MSIINNRFTLVNKLVQNQVKIEKEETNKEEKNTDKSTTDSDKGGSSPQPGTPKPKSLNSLDSNLLLTYRGINIDHIETAQVKSLVLTSDSGIKNKKTISATVTSDILSKTSLASDYKSGQSKSTTASQSKGLSYAKIQSMAAQDLNTIAAAIESQLKSTMGEYYDEKAVKKAVEEAIKKTIEEFTANEKNVKSTSYKAAQSDNGFVFSYKKVLFTKKGKASYNVKTLSDTFLKNYNEIAAKNLSVTIEIEEPKAYNPADYTVNKDMAKNSEIGKAYRYEETKEIKSKNLKATVEEMITDLNKSAYSDLQKVGEQIKKELKAKIGNGYREDVIDSVIAQAISETIISFAENKENTSDVNKLGTDCKYFEILTNFTGQTTKGSYNVTALVDTFLENINKQIASTPIPEELVKDEKVNRYQTSYLEGRYGLTESIRNLYFDKNVEPNGTYTFTVKDEYKDLKLANMRNDCFQRVSKSLIIQNFINDTMGTNILNTQNGTVLNQSNFHLFMDEVTMYSDDKSLYIQDLLVRKLKTGFAEGKITFNQSAALANALGVENIKMSPSGDFYNLSFKYKGQDYSLKCTKTAGKFGSDNKTTTLTPQTSLESYNASQQTIDKFFYEAVKVNGKVTHYALKEGMTINDFKQGIIEQGLQETYQSFDERYSKAFTEKADFASVFESAKNSAMEKIKKDNISEQKDINFIFERELSSSINNYLWTQYEKESAQTESQTDMSKYYRSASPMAAGAASKRKNNPQINASTTFPAKDGGTITINYQGVIVNGMLATDPNKGNAKCNITFTDKNGNKTNIPLEIGLDLLPEQNKKAVEEWKKSEYYYTGDPLDFVFHSSGKYSESDFYTPEQWLDMLMGHLKNSLSGLPEEAINVLKNKNSTISILEKNDTPDCARDAIGTYNNKTNVIALYTSIDKYRNCGDFVDDAFKSFVLAHELGHAQDYINGQNQSSKLFENLEQWNKFREFIFSSVGGAYALTYVTEFYAEYFAVKTITGTATLAGTTGQKSKEVFDYLENELQKNPNSEISKIYAKVKQNAECIRNSKPIVNNNQGVDTGKKYTKDEIIQKLKDDWTNDRINMNDIGAECEDLAATFGVKMETRDFLVEYYKHNYLNEKSDIITKIENASGTSKYGEPIKDLWNKVVDSSAYGAGLRETCDNFYKKIEQAQNTNPYKPNTDTNTEKPEQKKDDLLVTGKMNTNNMKGYVRAGDGLFLQSKDKGEYSSKFYEDAVLAAIGKYGDGLSLTFTAKADGTVSYTITKNGSGTTTHYVVVDEKSGAFIQGKIDKDNKIPLTEAQKQKFLEYAKDKNIEDMLSQNYSLQFDIKTRLPVKLSPMFEFVNPFQDKNTGLIDLQAVLENVFLYSADIYKDDDDNYHGFGKSAGCMYIALCISYNETGNLGTAIDAFNKLAKDYEEAKKEAEKNSKNEASDSGISVIGVAALSDAFDSFNKIVTSRKIMSMAEMQALAIDYVNYMKSMNAALGGKYGGYGGTNLDTETAKTESFKKIEKIYAQYKDPTERMIVIINQVLKPLNIDYDFDSFAKFLQRELEKERDVSHGSFNGGDPGSTLIGGGGNNPPIIDEPANPFEKDPKEPEDPFAKPDRPPMHKF